MLLLACAAPVVAPRPAAHGGGLAAWADAAVRGDGDAFRAAPPDGLDDPSVVAALAFGALADDAEERAEAVAGLASACGQCHVGVAAPVAPPLDHASAAVWAIDGLVWRRAAKPVLADPRLAAAIAAWDTPTPTDEAPERARVARWLLACAGCHTR